MDKFVFIKNFSAKGGPASGWDELPKNAGVYLFLDKNEKIYIGKAINIKNRVKSHFNQPSYRDHLFIDKVNKIGYIETHSEIEALVLEASLIKKYKPKYNIVWKDDKNYFYVAITKTEKPYIYITHQKNDDAEYIGPFVEGNSLKKTLKFLRKVFPYYTSAKHPKTKCTWCHLDLCPGPNPDLTEYKKNLKKLSLILQGKRFEVYKSLKKEMRKLSESEKFEEAGKIRDKMQALQQIISHAHVMEVTTPQKNDVSIMLQGITGAQKPVEKIECYDVSNIQGKFATSSMVVAIDGKITKSQYKKFKIRMENEPNDIAMLKETLQRRLAHEEWGYPQVILIDGGIAQLNVAIKVKDLNLKTRPIKVISLAKRLKELFIEGREKPVLLKTLPRDIYNLILQLDDEAHRFAITYHKKLRKKNLLQ